MSDTMLIAGAARAVVYVDPTGRTPGTYPSYIFEDGDSNYVGTYDYTGERRDEQYNEWSYQYWTGDNGKYLVKSGSYWYLFTSLPNYYPDYSEYPYRYSGTEPATGTWSGYYGSDSSFTVTSSWSDAGDGSTPALALSDLPAALADDTVYLIRRCNGAATLKNATYTGSAICLVGMPKSTDPDFGNAPLAAQQAWGSDTAEYAMVQCPPTRGVEASALSWLVLSRIYLMREATANKTQSHCFHASSTSVHATVSVNRCRFGVYGWDFDDPEYEDIQKYSAHGYMYITRCAGFRMADSTIVWTPQAPYSNSDSHRDAFFIQVQNGDPDISLTNIDVWSSFNPDHSERVPCLFRVQGYSSGYYCSGVRAEKVRFHLIHMATSEYLPQFMYVSTYCPYLCLRDISVSVAERDNGIDLDEVACHPEEYNGGGPDKSLFYFMYIKSYDIDGVSVAIPRLRVGWGATGIFYLMDYKDVGGIQGYARSIRDVDISLCALNEDAFDDNWGDDIYSRINTTSSSALNGAAFAVRLGEWPEQCHPAILTDIHVSNPKGFAAELYNCHIDNCDFGGHVRLDRCVADIDHITCDFPGRAIFLRNGAIAHVGTITLDKSAAKCTEYGGATGDYAAISDPADGTTLIVGTSTGDLCNLSGSSSGDGSINQRIYACNSARAAGRYVCRSKNMTAEAWSIYRTNGAAASLKITGVASGCIPWGRDPFKGFQATPASTGNKTVTLYLAHKGMSGTPNGNVRVVLAVPQADGSVSIINADAVSGWQEDSDSVWNGEQGLTCYKLSVPVYVGAKSPIEAKVFWSWYTASAYAYLDPKLEIV